ncbi:hypothetical protein Hanom_Chr16g01502661 [Helianthus anomalus]
MFHLDFSISYRHRQDLSSTNFVQFSSAFIYSADDLAWPSFRSKVILGLWIHAMRCSFGFFNLFDSTAINIINDAGC